MVVYDVWGLCCVEICVVFGFKLNGGDTLWRFMMYGAYYL